MRAITPLKFGYARDAADDPDLAIQMEALAEAGVLPDDIFTDALSRDPIVIREGFKALKERLGPETALVIWRLDRIGRDLSEFVQIACLIREAGAGLISLSEGLDSFEPRGEIAFELFDLLAGLEREMVRERTRTGYDIHLAEQKPRGRRVLLTDEKRRDVIKLMLEGLSFVEIAGRVGLSKSTLYNHEASLRAEAAIAAVEGVRDIGNG